jgi:hypothetical protein
MVYEHVTVHQIEPTIIPYSRDPFLDRHCETNNEMTSVARQQILITKNRRLLVRNGNGHAQDKKSTIENCISTVVHIEKL